MEAVVRSPWGDLRGGVAFYGTSMPGAAPTAPWTRASETIHAATRAALEALAVPIYLVRLEESLSKFLGREARAIDNRIAIDLKENPVAIAATNDHE